MTASDVSAGATFGSVLRRLRLAARLSQEELAERARMSVVSVSALERGRRRAPYRETVRLLGDALALSAQARSELESAARQARLTPAAAPAAARAPAQAAVRHNLPAEHPPLIGRDKDITVLAGMIREHRLVSVIGSGGIGKTRVALAAGQMLLDGAFDAVRFVEFASLADGSLVDAAAAQALGVAQTPGRALRAALVSALRPHRTLLIFDNCEHVIEAAAALTKALLEGCERLAVLTTSREPLRIAGEQLYRLPSLDMPPAAAPLTASAALDFPAVELFVERARAVDGDFTLTDTNAGTVAEICRLLDGIALAIELAAARVDTLPLPALLGNLDGHLRTSRGRARSALPRHQTMRAVIDWSYDLLSPREQRCFERLSAVAGSCALSEAAVMFGDDAADEWDALDVISQLVDKSVVAAEWAGTQRRYRLLESSRIYAADKLAQRGETAAAARRHACAYLALAQRLERAFETGPDAAWATGEADLGNFRSALTWTLAIRGDVLLGQQLADVLHPIWGTLPGDGKRWVDTALATVDERTPPRIAARLRFSAAHRAAAYLGRAAPNEIRSCLDELERLGDERGAARAQYSLGLSLLNSGAHEAGERAIRAAVDQSRRLDYRSLAASALQELGRARSISGDVDGARAALGDAAVLWRTIGARRGTAAAKLTLAEAEFSAGNVERSLQESEEALTILTHIDATEFYTVMARVNTAAYLIAAGRWDEARQRAGEALRAAYERYCNPWVTALAIQHLAAVAALSASGDGVRRGAALAARLLGFVDAVLADLGTPREPTEQREYERIRAAVAAALDTAAADQLAASGAALTQDQAVDIALAI